MSSVGIESQISEQSTRFLCAKPRYRPVTLESPQSAEEFEFSNLHPSVASIVTFSCETRDDGIGRTLDFACVYHYIVVLWSDCTYMW